MKAAEMDRITAKKATESEIIDIAERISNEAKQGHTTLSLNGVSQGAIAYLEDEGYEVSSFIFESYSSYTIKW